MKKRVVIVGISLLFIINLSAISTIGYHKYCRYRAECAYRKNCAAENLLIDQLSLTQQQIDNIESIRSGFQDSADRMNTCLCEKRAELLDCVKSANPDSQKIEMVLSQIDSMQAELQKNVIHCLLKEKEILTPEQERRFFSIIRERILQGAPCRQANELDPFIDNKCENECPIDNKSEKNKDEGR
jgi:Spy/CpxP family protein refolding chaperone